MSAARLTSAQWDELRLAFHRSLLIDTPLASLAQNVDGCAWPLAGAAEKPSAYIDLDHADALARLRAAGLPDAALDDLAEILRGTLAFDESFRQMAVIAGRAEAATDPVRRNLERLGIPEDFPVELGNFKPTTRQFCQRESIARLGDFLDFARSVSRQVIVGSEFRDLLNALAHVDEAALARLLPFRPKSRGLHLVEALAHVVRPLPLEDRMAVARRPESLSATAAAEVAARVAGFTDDGARIRAALAAGTPAARLVVSLDDLSLESAVAALLSRHFARSAEPTASPSHQTPRPPGRWRRLLGLAR